MPPGRGGFPQNYKQLGGFIGFQAGIGGAFQFFFAEVLFKGQFLRLEGFDPNNQFGNFGNQYGNSAYRTTGRLLGGAIRGGVQFHF